MKKYPQRERLTLSKIYIDSFWRKQLQIQKRKYMKTKIIVKIVVVMITTALFTLIMGGIFAFVGDSTFWKSCLYNIDFAIMIILPCLLIGAFVKKKLGILMLWGTLPGILIALAIYLSIVFEDPRMYPPTNFDILPWSIAALSIVSVSIMITILGYVIQRKVDK